MLRVSRILRASSVLDELGYLSAGSIQNGELDEYLGQMPEDAWRSALKTWASNQYDRIGEGSARVVYQLDDDHALKIATNRAGVAQNQVESHIAQKLHNLPITKVHYVGPMYAYLVVDFAHELDEMAFEATYGIPFKDFSNFCYEYGYAYAADVKKKLVAGLPKAALSLVKSLIKHGILLGDVGEEEQWGDLHGDSVLVDYGYNADVKQKYY